MNDGTPRMQVQGLEVLDTGLNLAELDLHGGDGLWAEVRRFCRESHLEAVVDGAMGGRAAPRVWALLESPGAGPAAAAAALGIATILADRGQAVVLVDADEQEPRLTRWLGRTEQEGWIDMVRFGASLHGASDALPSEGRQGAVLGVGSFAPTGVTPDEVADLLGRLRRQADDLVLVLPAKLRSLPWLEAAPIRLLSWDLLSRSADDTARILTELDRMGAGPDALLGFGVEEFHAIQERLQEHPAAAPPDAASGPKPATGPEAAAEPDAGAQAEAETEPTAAPPPGAGLSDADAGVTAGPAADGPRPGAELGPEGAVAESQTGGAADGDGDPAGAETPELVAAEAPASRPPRRRTSGVFVALAVVAVVALGGLALFLSGQLGGDDAAVGVARVDQGGTTPASRTGPAAGTPAAADQGSEAAAAADAPATGPADAAATGEPATGSGGEGAGEPTGEPATGAAEAPQRTAAEPAAEPATPAQAEAPEVPADSPDAATPAEPASPDTDAPPPALDRAAFRVPVGQDGWALWVYSFPDAEGADVEVRRLERRGLRATARAVELKDRGRWYRVYTGSFASRDAARAAVPALKAELDHDWVIPSRF